MTDHTIHSVTAFGMSKRVDTFTEGLLFIVTEVARRHREEVIALARQDWRPPRCRVARLATKSIGTAGRDRRILDLSLYLDPNMGALSTAKWLAALVDRLGLPPSTAAFYSTVEDERRQRPFPT